MIRNLLARLSLVYIGGLLVMGVHFVFTEVKLGLLDAMAAYSMIALLKLITSLFWEEEEKSNGQK